VMPHPGPRRVIDPNLLQDGDDPREVLIVRSPRGRLWLLRH